MAEEGSVLARRDVSATRRRDLATRELEDMEAKEMELMRSERKLIREQLQSLGKELTIITWEMENFKRTTLETQTKMRAVMNETMSELEEEKQARKSLADHVDQDIKKVKDELEQEKKDRIAGDERNAKELAKELQVVHAALDVQRKDTDRVDRELKELKDKLGAFPGQMEQLSDAIKKEVADRKAAEEPLIDNVRALREALNKELRELGDEHGKGLKGLKDLMDREKSGRENDVEDLKNQIGDIHRDVSPFAKQVPGLHTKLKDLGDLMHPQLKDHKDNLNKHKDDTSDKTKKIDQNIADLLKRIEGEAAARKDMMDELEQMQTGFRTKIRGMVTDEADKAKKDRDALAQGLDDANKKNKNLGDELAKLLDQLGGLKKGLDGCTDSINNGQADMDQKGKKVDELAKTLADLRNALEQGISDEKADFEMLFAFLEQHCTGLESLFSDLGHRLLNTGGLRRRTTIHFTSRTSVTTSLTTSLTTDSPKKAEPEPPKMRELPAPVKKEPEVKKAPVKKEPEVKKVPKLSEESHTKLKDILAGGRVALLADGGSHSADNEAEVREFQLKLNSTISFKKIHHGQNPDAIFSDEKSSTAMLKDVAGIMEVYPTATVQIEGHTATPDDKMDSWAQTLADNRARKVKSTIEDLGVPSSRLLASGMPGHLGDGHNDVKLKVVKF